MIRVRSLLILTVLTALWGAPSPVSAAVDELMSPSVSPSGGTTATAFTFRVRYDGRFEAATVHVTVAGRSIPMTLERGTRESGSWIAAGSGQPATRSGADELLGMVLVIGLAGIAGVAIAGTLFLLVMRRRSPGEPRIATVPAAADPLEHRMPLKARARLNHDPIVAALGIDDEMAARRAIRRARRDGLDPDDRPRQRPRS